ncbi:hypothetical protein VTL71DRAFT_8669 [Oculimacula yallundae]|uniref:6-phosphogluconolactonase n=1 Tax=Oculimacula yallundae TaxID=86028 RepID=A0ABR4CYB9_9HELO
MFNPFSIPTHLSPAIHINQNKMRFAYLLIPQFVSALVIDQRDDRNRAVYFLDDDPNGSSIVSLKINPLDGTLSDPLRISTRGKGLPGVVAGASPGSVPVPGAADPLFSQDSVVVSENKYLFTVNAGSNTVSLFVIDEDNPWNPKLINTAPSQGDFPVSIAYSRKLKTACTLNGGSKAGVACFSVDHSAGLTPIGSLRPIALGQSTPPLGPPGTASDIVFNPSSTALFVTIKGQTPSSGSIYAYPVSTSSSGNSISTTAVISNPSSLVVDFSISFLGTDSKAVIADPSFGAAIVDIRPDFRVTVSNRVVVPNQGATCWGSYSSRFNSIFLMDAVNPDIIILDPVSGAVTGVISQNPAGRGSFDSALDQNYIYTLKAGQSVSVSDLSGLNHGGQAKEVQSFDLSSLGPRATWIGMAVYPSS